jgi:hypothetical protein
MEIKMPAIKILDNFLNLHDVDKIEYLAKKEPLIRKIRFLNTGYEFYTPVLDDFIFSRFEDKYTSLNNNLVAQMRSEEIFTELKETYEKMTLGFWELEEFASIRKHFKTY